ncbi:hypothetical protein [Nocardioides sp. Kera G14]|uniref:hypothetical protein n=1 Tax=Nocardioides sp. Kera G14 TaxID=2884264 RepID=UPI001D117C50|nr:hypothetical protein [Nocardioides sp. Kera G14]UDY22960.1 hypothetical protein LH076_12920 [Nocardioides sp. Kera G14]
MIDTLLIHLTDATPNPKDVKAGWTAFVIFLLMFAAVVALGFSMAKQFRKAKRNREAGVLPSTARPAPQIPVAGPKQD